MAPTYDSIESQSVEAVPTIAAARPAVSVAKKIAALVTVRSRRRRASGETHRTHSHGLTPLSRQVTFAIAVFASYEDPSSHMTTTASLISTSDAEEITTIAIEGAAIFNTTLHSEKKALKALEAANLAGLDVETIDATDATNATNTVGEVDLFAPGGPAPICRMGLMNSCVGDNGYYWTCSWYNAFCWALCSEYNSQKYDGYCGYQESVEVTKAEEL